MGGVFCYTYSMEEEALETGLSQKKKNIIAIALLALAFLLFIYIFFPYLPSQFRQESEYSGKVVIGMVRWPGYVPFYVAQEKKYFNDQGVDVEIKSYDNLTELTDDYRNGKIIGRADTSYETALEALSGVDQKVVLAIDRSYGADAIIATPQISYVEQLRGKRVAFEYGTLEEFFLRYVLEERGLSLDDIVPLNLSPELAPQAVIDGRADAAVTFEPTLGKALETGKAQVIFSTAQEPGIITDILTFKSDFIKLYPRTVEKILRAYFNGYQYWQDNPHDAYFLSSDYLNETADNIYRDAGKIQYLGLVDNDVAFIAESGFHSLQENIYKALQFTSQQRGELFLRQRAADLLDPQFIIRLYNESRQQ